MSDEVPTEETAELLARAQQWAAQDPDIHTRRELLTMVSAASAKDETALATLRDSFDGRLQFGTAGLRGALGPGPNRMNRVVVMQAGRILDVGRHEELLSRCALYHRLYQIHFDDLKQTA